MFRLFILKVVFLFVLLLFLNLKDFMSLLLINILIIILIVLFLLLICGYVDLGENGSFVLKDIFCILLWICVV